MGEAGGEMEKPRTPEVPKEMQPGKNVDVNTGKGVAGWVLRVEGRVLDVISESFRSAIPLMDQS